MKLPTFIALLATLPSQAVSATNEGSLDFDFRVVSAVLLLPLSDVPPDVLAFEDPCEPSRSIVPEFPLSISGEGLLAEVYAENHSRAAHAFDLVVSATVFATMEVLEEAAWRLSDGLCLQANRLTSEFRYLGVGAENWHYRFAIQCSGTRIPVEEHC